MIVEKSFPRGGHPAKETTTTTTTTTGPKNKNDNIVFGAMHTKVKKPKQQKDKVASPEELLQQQLQNDTIETHSAELLNYETIQDGMNIMGMVNSVDPLFVTISLPGRMVARISALEISDAYTKAAKEFLEKTNKAESYKTLEDLYKVGQIVYGRVLEVKQHKPYTRPEISMTFKPSEVHAELVHSNVRKGFIFNGAISEIQEHGYVIESGIKNLRSFLPLEKAAAVGGGQQLALGQLVFLKVDKITIDERSASTCQCKQIQMTQMKVKTVQSTNANIDYLLPSTIVQFHVTKLLKDGLQGTIMNDAFTAYVNEHQLEEPLKLPEDYEINGKYNARILYVMPLTKLVYLSLNLQDEKSTMNNDDDGGAQAFKRGDIIDAARVHHIGTGGVVLVLKNQYKGLISYKIIKSNYKGNYDQDELLNKYSKKSKHRVRILDYDPMDSLYICSDDTNVVEEKYFSLNDIRAGDYTQAIIKSQAHEGTGGYFVTIGMIRGLCERLYLQHGNNKNYEINSKIRCRIVGFNFERNIVYLTNRAEYMSKDCKILTDIKDARTNSVFMGTIVNVVNTHHYLVKFFNNIMGILFKDNLNNAYLMDKSIDLYEGQTMLFRVLGRIGGGEKLKLGLVEDVSELGEISQATVSHVLETGLEINIKPNNNNKNENDNSRNDDIKGIVPLRFLSDFDDLFAAKLRIYNINTKLDAVSIHKNIFSVRDVAYFQEHGVKDWNTIAVGDILRAFIENVVDNEVIELFVPIRGYGKPVKLHLKMLLLELFNVRNIELYPEQVIYVKIIGKEDATRTISVTAKLNSVWDQQMNSTASYVERYLGEVDDIRRALKKKGNAIARLNIGDKITLTFKGIDPETQNWHYQDEKSEIFAIAKSSIIAASKMKPPKDNQKNQEAIILWIDYSNDVVYISPNPTDVKHIQKAATRLPEEFVNAQHAKAKVLLKLNNIFICSLKKGPNPLIFCPIRLHFNDFEETASSEIEEGDFCKLAFIHETKPIAVLQRAWDVFQQNRSKKRKTSINEDDSGVPSSPTKMKARRLDSGESEENEKKKPKLVNHETTEAIKSKKLKDPESAEGENPTKKQKKKTKISINESTTEIAKKKIKITDDDVEGGSEELDIDSKKAKEIGNKKQKQKKTTTTNESMMNVTKKPKSNHEATEEATKQKLKGSKETKIVEEDEEKTTKPETEAKLETDKKEKNSTTDECKEVSKVVIKKSKSLEAFLSKLKNETNEGSSSENKLSEQSEDGGEPIKYTKLPGVENFWTLDLDKIKKEIFSFGNESDDENAGDEDEVDKSGDDDDDDAHDNKKKKRLNAVEKFKKQREEEARLREIEAQYADPNHLPETVDQFDRLVLSDPNNSENWIKYMVFHLQFTEVEKARAVAQRALKSISMRNSDDHLNIWIALLNLEIRYGNAESFDSTLKEALTVNEPINVYLRVVEILKEVKKQQELVDMIGVITKKFKSSQDVWKTAADAYFSIGMTDKAQQMLHKCLASLPEREHVNTIVLFANLNHRHGCNEMAHTLLDQVVTSYPKRVDVWAQYVDMLVKDKLIDSARSVLERAILQKIPIKKMRTIFKKYLEFEERHGTARDVEKVKRLATEYVKQNANVEN